MGVKTLREYIFQTFSLEEMADMILEYHGESSIEEDSNLRKCAINYFGMNQDNILKFNAIVLNCGILLAESYSDKMLDNDN